MIGVPLRTICRLFGHRWVDGPTTVDPEPWRYCTRCGRTASSPEGSDR